MRVRYTKFGLPIISGGQDAFPAPFFPDWGWYLPVAMQAVLVEWAVIPPSWMDDLCYYAAVLMPVASPAIAAYNVAYHAYREYYNLDPEQTPPAITIPENPTPLTPGSYPSIYSGGSVGAPIDAAPTQVGWDCHLALRDYANQDLSLAIGRLLAAQVVGARLPFSPVLGWTQVDTVALGDMETELVGACDGARVVLTTVPAKYGSISFDSADWCYPRLGTVCFGIDGSWDERQKLEMASGLYVPRNIASAEIVRVRTKPGVEGTLTTYTMAALC
jgi:hypothetical protein